MNFVMRNGATGCEVVVSGKLRAQRAKVMKFRDGYLISTGDPKKHYIQEATRHVLMRQGVLGVKVKIMMKHDPTGRMGAAKIMPDNIVISEPKETVVPPVQDSSSYFENVVDGEAAAPVEPVGVEQEAQEYVAEQPAADAGAEEQGW
jgi:small subunit ribosomal protein S3e